MKDTIYNAVFIDDVEKLYRLFPAKLSKKIDCPHMTVKFVARTGEAFHPELYGSSVDLVVTGYACDGKNEGLLVDPWADDPHMQRLCGEITVPHVTLSVADSGKPVDTAKLDFMPVASEKEIVLRGTYGAYTKNGLDLGVKR